MRESEEELLKAVLTLLMAIPLSLLINFPVMWLWNWLMPTIFHLPSLTFWQMYGLTILVSLFTSYFRRRGK